MNPNLWSQYPLDVSVVKARSERKIIVIISDDTAPAAVISDAKQLIPMLSEDADIPTLLHLFCQKPELIAAFVLAAADGLSHVTLAVNGVEVMRGE